MKSKPHILFAMDTMLCGGIEKSALSLLNALDPNKVMVTLCLDKRIGDFLAFVPDWVNITDVKYSKDTLCEKNLGRKRFLALLLLKLNFIKIIKLLRALNRENRLDKDQRRIHRAIRYYDSSECDTTEYDLAVAYANIEQHIYVAQYIQAKRKVAWFHTQIDTSRENFREYLPIMQNFNTLFCVSKALKKSFITLMPELKDKVKFYPHIINVKMLYDWAKREKVEWTTDNETKKILSVGRLSYQKGFDLIPYIASKLKTKGYKFEWVILGGGSELMHLQQLVKSQNVQDCVFFKGISLNPYPFYQSCDLYVQTSRYEGYCLTLAEARAFRKPIVSTIFDGSLEQLNNGECGLLARCDVDELYKAIDNILSDNILRDRLTKNLSKQVIDNSDGVDILLKEIYL